MLSTSKLLFKYVIIHKLSQLGGGEISGGEGAG